MGDKKQENDIQKLSKKKKKFLSLRSVFFYFYILAIGSIFYYSNTLVETKIENHKESVYLNTSEDILAKFDILLKERINSSTIIAIALSKNLSIQNALIANDPSKISFNTILDEVNIKKEYVDLQMEIINKDGINFVRSWNELSGDNLIKDNENLRELFRNPKISTSITASKFGLTITNKIPIFHKSILIGFFGLNLQLDSLTDVFKEKGFKSIIVLNALDSNNIIQNLSHTQKFIEDKYIVNKNADKYLMRVIRDNGINKEYCKVWDKSYHLEYASGHFVSKYIIKSENSSDKANVFIFKNLVDIKFPNIKSIQQIHLMTSLVIIIVIAFMMVLVYSRMKVKIVDKENRALIVINEDLSMKAKEMDFNDKKLENLFNMQPNLMMMHNGKEITQANQRFMGFFNRFKTFVGFREEHKCVCELFEPYDAPNYISTSEIDGLFWIDYILKNPKRMYKVVISYTDKRMSEPHHFIIKLNEMEYAKKIADRLIIIALVDMTQDLVNYKSLEELSKMKELESNEK
ncbi:MAG: hypothetical protein DRG78_13350 [Epsilonproteobacteria bacterium]|nr:MAG: hypothetical protein DRG78_13350 [Campylobacterota bacterium]